MQVWGNKTFGLGLGASDFGHGMFGFEHRAWKSRMKAGICSRLTGRGYAFVNQSEDLIAAHVGGCQNYGPFLDPYYNTAPNIGVPKKGP